jgi:mannose-6-phosphate isomerase-like protein (cupin superfamily)/CDGSH-type Zn-finger protein
MSTPMEPTIARLKPCLVSLTAGRTYFWCSCGRSNKQPFCDGSHKGTGFEPIKYVAGAADEELLLCACKRTSTPPFCDGSHTNLPGGSPWDDPDSEANRGVPVVEADGPRTALNGNCYVFSPTRAQMRELGSVRECETISTELGAQYQTQRFMQVSERASPVMSFGDRHAILFVAGGSGAVVISGRRFEIERTDGVYIRPTEGFQLIPDLGITLDVFVTVCPFGELRQLDDMPSGFDESCPHRVVSVDAAQRTAMGPRYFQLLVDKSIGSTLITQFIGHIPQSKAAPHRHLYEESIIVLAGEGYMWTEDRKAKVSSGDVIFLPRKQIHSLQATSPEGIDVVGVIYPGNNPSINY